jgi:hypothetical protein
LFPRSYNVQTCRTFGRCRLQPPNIHESLTWGKLAESSVGELALRLEKVVRMSNYSSLLAVGIVALAGACSSSNGADSAGASGAANNGSVGGNGASANNGGAANGTNGGSGNNSVGGDSVGGAGYLGGAGNVGGGGSLGGTGGALTTGTGRTCAACDTTCCLPDDCGVIGFVACQGALVDCGFTSCAQSLCGTGLNGNPGTANKCPGTCTPTVTMADCQAAGKNCDSIPDGCGGLFSCGTCTAPDTCGGGGIAFQCGSNVATPCANFCPMVPTTCALGADTVLHGTVWSPAGNPAINPTRGEVPLPIPNAMIYVPNGSTTAPYGLSVFTDGVANGCDCTVQGPPLNIFPSGVDGSLERRDSKAHRPTNPPQRHGSVDVKFLYMQ